MKETALTSSTFAKYAAAVRNYRGDPLDPSLLLDKNGDLCVQYAPFEWVNHRARVVLVGITPGKVQAANALQEAKAAMLTEASEEETLRRARATGAFSGAMRPNLISLLDSIGLQNWLGVGSCGDLFGSASNLMQTASVLQFPVFLRGENYNGTPDPTKHPLLRRMLIDYFGQMAATLPNAVFVPLGPVPSKAMDWLASQGRMSGSQVLHGLPHPSGANAERIAYFLGRKAESELSGKTDPAKLDAAKALLIAKVAALL